MQFSVEVVDVISTGPVIFTGCTPFNLKWCQNVHPAFLISVRLVRLLVRRQPQKWATWVQFPLILCGSSRSSHTITSELKHWYSRGYPANTLCYRVSNGTGWTGVSTMWLGEIVSLSCKLLSQSGSTYNCMSQSVLVRYTSLACCWDVKQLTNNNTLIFKPKERSKLNLWAFCTHTNKIKGSSLNPCCVPKTSSCQTAKLSFVVIAIYCLVNTKITTLLDT